MRSSQNLAHFNPQSISHLLAEEKSVFSAFKARFRLHKITQSPKHHKFSCDSGNPKIPTGRSSCDHLHWPPDPRSAATFSMGILRWSTDLRSECREPWRSLGAMPAMAARWWRESNHQVFEGATRSMILRGFWKTAKTPKSVDHCGFAPDSHECPGLWIKATSRCHCLVPLCFPLDPILAQGTWWPARRMPRWSHRCRCPPPSAQPGRSSTAMVQLEGGMPFLRSIRTKKIVEGESGEVQNSEDTSNKFLWPLAS